MLIAEIGQNHCGSMVLARRLIFEAKRNGADLAKFQLYDSKKIYGEYQKSELSKEQAFMLFNYGKEAGIEVFFSVFDVGRVRWCEEMGVKRYKIASRSNTDFDLIDAIIATNKPIIISVSSTPMIDANHPTVRWFNKDPNLRLPPIDHLYCIPHYPTALDELHFRINSFAVYSGFSDHTLNLTASKVAISRGAKIIERHFCINKQTGVDAPWSMTPSELRELREFYDVAQEAL